MSLVLACRGVTVRYKYSNSAGKPIVVVRPYTFGCALEEVPMIRKLSTGQYRLYSRKRNPKTGKRRNLGTFKTRKAAMQHEREVQFFKRH